MQQQAKCIHTKRKNFAHFKWEKKPSNKIITIGGVKKNFIVIDGMAFCSSVHIP
jgi:hypothetical protein